ncbi:MAG: APC family permease [Acidobacteriota bacterium]|nr:APC family permease [Acidobacteriota bacterium]
MRLIPLIGATYFMVSGGPYGLEDIIGGAGYGRALLLLLLVPLVWSLPTSLMVGELASALPEEGGYYRWVRRALGPFWGFQEAWLSLAASIFDMAIYPVTFVLYLSRIAPTWTAGPRGTLWALGVVVLCAAWNLRGARSVGQGSVAIFVLLLAPFGVLIVLGLYRAAFSPAACSGCLVAGGLSAIPGTRPMWSHISANLRHSFTLLRAPAATPSLAAALSVTLWNYMGWDNASTVAQEVEDPQRNYPRAMLLSAALVAATYILPLAAVGLAGIPADRFSTGAWADAAHTLGGQGIGGPILAFAVVLGGTLNGAGMFNALMLSYARVPYALAADGLLPRIFTRTTRADSNVPWVSILVCAFAWALALRLPFERLISIDLVLYGAALVLEFVALVVLRVREPALPRPFRIPGGVPAVILAGVGPTLLIAFALYAARNEHVGPLPALLFAALVSAAGPLAWLLARRFTAGPAAAAEPPSRLPPA